MELINQHQIENRTIAIIGMQLIQSDWVMQEIIRIIPALLKPVLNNLKDGI